MRSLVVVLGGALVIGAAPRPGLELRSDDPALSERHGFVFRAKARLTGVIVGPRSSRTFRDGLLDGTSRVWHPDGTRAELRQFREGRKTGTHRGWWPTGRRQFECTYAGDLAIGECRDWYATGQLAAIHRYAAGVEAGLQQGWDRAGSLQFSYEIRDGRRYGLLGSELCRPDSQGGRTLPYYGDSTLTPSFDADSTTVHRVGGFHLTDQRARAVTERDFDGRITVATFFYVTCKDLCPRLESRMAAVRAAFPHDPQVQIVSITLAPDHDTAPVLTAYAHANRIDDDGWRLLTGSAAEIARVAREGFFASAPMLRALTVGTNVAAAGQFHGETIWLPHLPRGCDLLPL